MEMVDIMSIFGHFILMIFLQFAPVSEMQVGDTHYFENETGLIKIELVDIPSEDYWVIDAEILDKERNPTGTKINASGYYDAEASYLFSFTLNTADGYTEEAFSVNENGNPLIFQNTEGPKKEWFYAAATEESTVYFVNEEEFHFKGGINYTRHYRLEAEEEEDFNIFIETKHYNDSVDGRVISIEFTSEDYPEFNNRFWKSY